VKNENERPPASVAVVGDEEIVLRRTVASLGLDGLAVIAQVSDPAELLRTSEDATPDAVVVVVEQLGEEQLDCVRAVRELLPKSSVLCLAAFATARDVREAFSAGADGLVVDDDSGAGLAPAVRAACAGQLSLPREFRALFAKPVLSAREKQILGMVVMGFSNGEIARKLYLAEATVKTHLSSAFGKLGVRSRSEAADLILDPRAGLGTGILAIVGDEGRIGPSG
jgi:DNA-binding NarL/FixJ family response regulator